MCDKDLSEEETILLDGLPVCSKECREALKENGTGEPVGVLL
jgi:hypothetical protein